MIHINSSWRTATFRQAPHIVDKLNSIKAQTAGFGWSSNNWSGYAITRNRGTINSVAGEWIVPTVKSTKRTSYSSAWVGIDGFNNTSLIQAGTGHDYYNGSAHYYAWWEILPAMETRIPHRVGPGDRMRVEIRNLSGSRWSIRVMNLTRNWTFRTVRTYSGPRTSAEWIVEAPQVNGRNSVLADYGRTAFNLCRVNGRYPRLMKSNGGVMTQNNVQVSTPSAPDSEGDGFTIAYGRTLPPAPGSAAKRSAREVSSSTTPLLYI